MPSGGIPTLEKLLTLISSLL